MCKIAGQPAPRFILLICQAQKVVYQLDHGLLCGRRIALPALRARLGRILEAIHQLSQAKGIAVDLTLRLVELCGIVAHEQYILLDSINTGVFISVKFGLDEKGKYCSLSPTVPRLP